MFYMYLFLFLVQVRPLLHRDVIASAVAKIYDVLGWHAPAVIIVKILLRELWQLHLEWDDKVPESIVKEWNHCKN